MSKNRKLKRELQDAGYLVTKTRGSHFRVTHPTKPGFVIMGSTPGEGRAWQNGRAALRRMFGKPQE